MRSEFEQSVDGMEDRMKQTSIGGEKMIRFLFGHGRRWTLETGRGREPTRVLEFTFKSYGSGHFKFGWVELLFDNWADVTQLLGCVYGAIGSDIYV